MVQYKIYTFANVTENTLGLISSKLKLLEKKTTTEIVFNFEQQYFNIEAASHENCNEAASIISENLLPRLNKRIEANFVHGVFSDSETYNPTTQKLDDSESIPERRTIIGRPLSPGSGAEDNSVSEEEEEGKSQNQAFVSKIFKISNNIKNITDDFLKGPLQQNMQAVDYLEDIPLKFGVECTLHEREIQIVGSDLAVEKAYNAFSMIQKTVIGQSKTILIPCIHYPGKSAHYGLYFCSLNQYKQKSFVYTHLNQVEASNMHVILPVFIDKTTQEYGRPKDLLKPQLDEQTQSQYRSTTVEQLNIVMDRVANNESSQPCWGEDRNFVNSYNNGDMQYLPNERLARAFTPPPQSDTVNNNYCNDQFPSLPTPSHIKQPKKQPQQRNTRRVMRIIPQKAPSVTISPSKALLQRVKDYNYQNMKGALVTGLESVRGFRGEVKLFAKIGKVLWPIHDPDIKSRIWELEDIIHIVVRELKTIPKFTTMTTNDLDLLELMTSEKVITTQSFYNKTAIFEFHCSARNQPSLPYKPLVLHMNQGVVNIKKVVASEKTVVEVDWVNLDRKFDFQLSLATKELLRCDVKPFTSFNKKVSICPITQSMTFENVPNFLHVNFVIFKQTTRFRIIFPFVVEIVRVEKVPLYAIPNSNKINAAVGKGEFWFDFQVYSSIHEDAFQSNLKLNTGEAATWTVDDILHPESDPTDIITSYVKHMLTIVEKIEIAVKNLPS